LEAALDTGQRQSGLRREAQFAHLVSDHGGGLAFVEAGLGVMQDRLAELDDLVAVTVDRLAHRLFQLFLGRHAAPRTSAPCPASEPGIPVFLAVIRGRRKTGRIGWPGQARPRGFGGASYRGWPGSSPARSVWRARMNDFNRHQMLAALVGLVTALFVMGGLPGRWRRQLRMAAIVFFLIAVAAALVEIGLWLAEPG